MSGIWQNEFLIRSVLGRALTKVLISAVAKFSDQSQFKPLMGATSALRASLTLLIHLPLMEPAMRSY